MSDNLFVVKTEECHSCKNAGRRSRRQCEHCRQSGFEPIDLSGLWKDKAGFLVCGGSSLNDFPLECLRERGVVSVGVNNAAAYAPCSAFTFHDGQEKFHHALYEDPKLLCFVPTVKLNRSYRAKVDGSFHTVHAKVKDSPGVFGYARTTKYWDPEDFLTSDRAQACAIVDCPDCGGSGESCRKCKGKGTIRPISNKPMSFLLGMRVAHYLGIRRLYLLGMDLMTPYAWESGPPSRKYGQTEQYMDCLMPVLERQGFIVRQVASERSRLSRRVVPPVDWHTAITDCRGTVPSEPLELSDWYSKSVKKRDADRFPQPVTKELLSATYAR